MATSHSDVGNVRRTDGKSPVGTGDRSRTVRAPRRRMLGLPAIAAAVAITASACGSSGLPAAGSATSAAAGATAAGCKAGATVVTFWGWSAGYNLAVDEFNKTHPDICVELDNAGATTTEYTKLTNALTAKSGTPDVAQIEYFELPSFEVTNSLVDLTRYGISTARNNEAGWAWDEVSRGSGVYAMPVDAGTMALYYNQKEFNDAGITTTPATWAEFAADAAKLKARNSSEAITNFDPESTQTVLALMQEYGAFPFTYTGGSTVGINFTGAAEKAFARYWQGLIDAKEVTAATEFSQAQWNDFDNGSAASRLSPAWGPVGMQGSISKTIGDWRAAALPQTVAGTTNEGNWGGSTLAVVKGTKVAQAAATFVQWFGGSDDAWKILSGTVAGAYPAYTPLLDSSSFLDSTLKISGDSTYNKVFADAESKAKGAEWPPIMTAALTQWTSTFAGVTKGTETLEQAFTAFQSQMVTYAKDQGFTVEVGS
jgi:multiple sugar transport system substrate-binding protein